MEQQNRVQWVYSSNNNQELEERYDVWAQEYDADLDQDFGWVCPQRSAEALARHTPLDASILDAGAGTGLVGEILGPLGYKDMVAMDLSQGMLDVAAQKGVYRAFDQMTLGERLDYDDGQFGAVISVGVMTLGHAPASSLGRTGTHYQAGRVCRLQPAGRHVQYRQRVRAATDQDGEPRHLVSGRSHRPFPRSPQRRA